MPKNHPTFIKPKLLIVEGMDDLNLMVKILNHLNVNDVQVHEIMGVNGLTGKIQAITKTPGFPDVEKITLMLDCDENQVAREQSIRDALKAAGLAIPETSNVRAPGPPSVYYSLVPGGAQSGCLEHVLTTSFCGDARLACVDTLLQCVNHPAAKGSNEWEKARIHCLLSTFPLAGLKIGEAATANYFDLGHAAFQPLHDLVTDLAA